MNNKPTRKRKNKNMEDAGNLHDTARLSESISVIANSNIEIFTGELDNITCKSLNLPAHTLAESKTIKFANILLKFSDGTLVALVENLVLTLIRPQTSISKNQDYMTFRSEWSSTGYSTYYKQNASEGYYEDFRSDIYIEIKNSEGGQLLLWKTIADFVHCSDKNSLCSSSRECNPAVYDLVDPNRTEVLIGGGIYAKCK